MKKRKMKKKWKIIFSLMFTGILLISVGGYSYSRYTKDVNVNIEDTTGKTICDLEIDDTIYISNKGYAYFKVTIKNYDENENITNTDIKYQLEVKNKEGSTVTGSYRWLDQYGYSNNVFEEVATTREYEFTKNGKETHLINIEVKTEQDKSEKVDYELNLTCTQKYTDHVTARLKNNVITANVISEKFDIAKYCLNNKATSTEGCTWKETDSKTITETLNDVGDYTIHVMDKSGIVMHSNTVSLKSFADLLIASNKLWDSGLEGDGLRYVGSGAYDSETTPDNFICFGTSSSETCIANRNKYMYRIIGVFQDEEGNEHLKLIKFDRLGGISWHSDNTTDINWEESSMYTNLNGSHFLKNTSFDYLQKSSWLDKISNWKWTAVNTKTSESGLDYSREKPKNIYLHEMNRSTKTSTVGDWTYPTGKIGLMYASDYVLSLGEITLSNNSISLITGWLQSQNISTWILPRYGKVNNQDSYMAYRLNRGGNITGITQNSGFSTNPVFYLEKNVVKAGGDGTYENPFIIAE